MWHWQELFIATHRRQAYRREIIADVTSQNAVIAYLAWRAVTAKGATSL